MNDVGLRYTLNCWKDIAAQPDVRENPLDAAFVQVMLHEYSLKVVEREEQDKEWLKHMATPKKGSQPQSQSQSQSQTKRTAGSGTGTGTTTSAQTAKAKQRAEEKQKAQETKAAAVRAEKEKMLQKAAVEARKRAEQIARARAKAAPAPVRPRKDVPKKNTDEELGADAEAPKPGAVRKPCGICGKGHASLAEWIKCNVQAHRESSTDEDSATDV
jgi:hypothetical protein